MSNCRTHDFRVPANRYRCAQFGILVVSLCVVTSLAQRSDTPDAQKNPFAGNGAAIAAGAALYRQTCEACHGGEGRGDRGPALATGNLWHGSEDADMFHAVRNGIPGTQMPAFALPTDSVWCIISYLRSLSGNSGAANEIVPGDVAAGEKIFWSQGGCGRCHEVNGRGGIVAPDLSTPVSFRLFDRVGAVGS